MRAKELLVRDAEGSEAIEEAGAKAGLARRNKVSGANRRTTLAENQHGRRGQVTSTHSDNVDSLGRRCKRSPIAAERTKLRVRTRRAMSSIRVGLEQNPCCCAFRNRKQTRTVESGKGA